MIENLNLQFADPKCMKKRRVKKGVIDMTQSKLMVALLLCTMIVSSTTFIMFLRLDPDNLFFLVHFHTW